MNSIGSYHCYDHCHTFLVWATPLGPGESPARSGRTFCLILPAAQPGVIHNRVTGVDRLHAERAEFSPQGQWLLTLARIHDEEWKHLPRQKQPCWAPVIRSAAAHVVEVEIRSLPLVSALHAL
jgi:hypothetical protein